MSSLTFLRLCSTIALLSVTDFGDFLESRPIVLNCATFHAVLDNMIHIWIGILTWSVVADDPSSLFSPQLLIVILGASFIDLDHFLVARSLSLKEAMNAGHRGIFHCTGLAILISIILLKTRPQAALLFLIAVIPHHLRDSTRRGLYLLPFTNEFASTMPLAAGLVRILLPVFPWILIYFRKYFGDGGAISNSGSSTRIFNV